MNIEKNLRGGKFKKLLERTMADAKNKTNLNRLELEVIYLLSHYDEMTTLTDICRYTQMNKGHMSTTLDNLVKKGYVVCKRDDKDRRYVKYELTDASEQICKEMEAVWSEMISKVVEGIDENSLVIFNSVSEQISRNIDRLLEND
ncbi:MAG: MarR family winged helix-turn-helix transcriptional regulator [Lachnospiraceae bacterium]